ncbi:MAG: hypothetical protein IJN51_05720 [Alistipes sp.]|nr:hypothetical protein [Alistipes sp.]
MKKMFIFAALAFGLASCQNETNIFGVDINNNEEAVEFTITATAPEVVETRVANKGYTFSEKGGIENGALSGDKTMRYILEVYDKDDRRSEEIYYAYGDVESVEFKPRLIPGHKYTFVVWADIVNAAPADLTTKAADVHYNTADLTNVTLKADSWAPMDETRDAFTGFHVEDELLNTDQITIPLTRPFGKLRIVTTDEKDVAKLNVTPDYAEVEYTGVPVYSFNAKTGIFTEQTPATLAKSHAKFEIADYSTSNADVNEITLFTDYFFAPSTEEVALGTFTLNVYDNDTDESLIVSTTFSSSIPVKRNRLTTVKGNLLTMSGDTFKITAEANDAFGESEKVITIN